MQAGAGRPRLARGLQRRRAGAEARAAAATRAASLTRLASCARRPQLLWETNQGVSQLRIKFLASLPPGGPTHTVMVTDVPGLAHGTFLDRVRGRCG